MSSSSMRVPAERYTSPTWLAAELDAVFGAAWLLAAHSSELEGAGAFTVFEIAGESILITRDAERVPRAFFNVCQHRGALLCTEARGTADSFRCPYHHWEYARDGRLLRAPGAGPAAVGKNGRPVALRPLACAERFGFIWVSMAQEPSDIDAYLSPVASELGLYQPELYRLATESVVEVNANWKTSVDINNESYHLATLHPGLLEVVDARAAAFALRGDHSTQSLPIGQPSRELPPDERITEPLRGLLRSLGVEGFPENGRIADLRPAIAAAFRERAIRAGLDLGAFSDEALTRKQQIHVFPNVQLNFLPFSLEVYRHRPHPSDPSRCWFDEWSFLRPSEARKKAPQRRHFRHGEQDLGPVMGADVDMLPRLQQGLCSRGFSTLHLAAGEECIAHMHRVLEQWINAKGAS